MPQNIQEIIEVQVNVKADKTDDFRSAIRFFESCPENFSLVINEMIETYKSLITKHEISPLHNYVYIHEFQYYYNLFNSCIIKNNNPQIITIKSSQEHLIKLIQTLYDIDKINLDEFLTDCLPQLITLLNAPNLDITIEQTQYFIAEYIKKRISPKGNNYIGITSMICIHNILLTHKQIENIKTIDLYHQPYKDLPPSFDEKEKNKQNTRLRRLFTKLMIDKIKRHKTNFFKFPAEKLNPSQSILVRYFNRATKAKIGTHH